MPKQKLIIDCDTGVDDAMAIMIALNSVDVEVVAITCVDGNATVDNAVKNSLIVTSICGVDIPVYRGCSKPLSTTLVRDVVHGSDGLSGASSEYHPNPVGRQTEHAANALVQLVNQNPGEITLVALGPLTNVALAFRLDDRFSEKLSRLVIMGGCNTGRGNVRMNSEFNFVFDPEAAQIVVEEARCPCALIPYESCALDDDLSWDWYASWISKAEQTERGKFLKRIVEPFAVLRRDRAPNRGFGICDPYAMAIALLPDIITSSEKMRVTVETGGSHTRGYLVIAWRDYLFPRQGNLPVEIVHHVDKERLMKLYDSLVSAS